MSNVSITQKDSIFDQIERIRHRIEQRAYELFRHRDGGTDDPLDDWLRAEEQILWKPAVELREKDGTFTVLAALAGVEPKDVIVDVTSQDLVIKAETSHEHSSTTGQVHQCEFVRGQLFRSVHFPNPVDPDKAKAEYRNGLLTVTVPAAPKAQAKPVEIKAA